MESLDIHLLEIIIIIIIITIITIITTIITKPLPTFAYSVIVTKMDQASIFLVVLY